jgi:protein-tyrosine phosphatase
MNFRDFGGIPASGNCIIKEGILFRSATIDNITRVDSLKLHDLNIRTIIDLRAPKEVKKRRRSIDHVAVVSLPLDFQQTTRERIKPYLYKKDSDKILADISNQLYLDILDAAAPVFRQIVELIISDEAVPILIHCQAGKDRTGILAALILLALGTDRQLIVDDFMKSNDELLPYFKKLLLIRKLLTLGYFPAKGMLNIITAKRRNIDSIFGRVQNHYGGIEGYLASAGFDVSRLKDFREKLCSA